MLCEIEWFALQCALYLRAAPSVLLIMVIIMHVCMLIIVLIMHRCILILTIVIIKHSPFLHVRGPVLPQFECKWGLSVFCVTPVTIKIKKKKSLLKTLSCIQKNKKVTYLTSSLEDIMYLAEKSRDIDLFFSAAGGMLSGRGLVCPIY